MQGSRRALIARSAVLAALALGLGQGAAAGSFEDFFSSLELDNIVWIERLAKRGFDVNTRNESDQPPLVMALKADSLRVAEFLARHPGTDIDAVSANGENALMIAALKGHVGILKLLLARGAEANKPGWAPLHYAATYGGNDGSDPGGHHGPEMVALLLEHHAYIDAESPNGTTPLMMAARYGSSRSVELLLEAGADPTLKNQQKLGALDFARQADRRESAGLIARAIKARRSAGTQ